MNNPESIITVRDLAVRLGTTRSTLQSMYGSLPFRVLPSDTRQIPADYADALADLDLYPADAAHTGLSAAVSDFSVTDAAHHIMAAAQADYAQRLATIAGAGAAVPATIAADTLQVSRRSITDWLRSGTISAAEVPDSRMRYIDRPSLLRALQWHNPSQYNRSSFVPAQEVAPGVSIETIDLVHARKGPATRQVVSIGRVSIGSRAFAVNHRQSVKLFGSSLSADALALKAGGLSDSDADRVLLGIGAVDGRHTQGRINVMRRMGTRLLAAQVSLAFQEGVFVPVGMNAGFWHVHNARQVEVLVAAASGLTQERTAQYLRLSTETVTQHRAALFDHLGVHTIQAAVTLGYLSGQLYTPQALPSGNSRHTAQ